ncbi:hypothetical protein DFJ74DRAFT_678559 [Hyaloraphidium curvatum]|nr:hypothetical protein DFJ74DRAFT_678559 [Hyaloraphidium curvatum]
MYRPRCWQSERSSPRSAKCSLIAVYTVQRGEDRTAAVSLPMLFLDMHAISPDAVFFTGVMFGPPEKQSAHDNASSREYLTSRIGHAVPQASTIIGASRWCIARGACRRAGRRGWGRRRRRWRRRRCGSDRERVGLAIVRQGPDTGTITGSSSQVVATQVNCAPEGSNPAVNAHFPRVVSLAELSTDTGYIRRSTSFVVSSEACRQVYTPLGGAPEHGSGGSNTENNGAGRASRDIGTSASLVKANGVSRVELGSPVHVDGYGNVRNAKNRHVHSELRDSPISSVAELRVDGGAVGRQSLVDVRVIS